jgi:branched-chain amino acid transport system substrate-binding protein
VTPTTILIGGADAVSPNARGAAAYFRYVNARGGVHGRSIVFRFEDPNVFAELPQLFGDFRLSGRAEGWILGSYLARTRRGARVGVLHSDDERGRELLAGLRQAVARSTVRVAEALMEADPTTDVEALQASGADVLALLVATPRDAARAATALGWRPHIVVASGTPGGIEGAVSLAFAKDPRDPSWRDDPGLRRHRSVMARADDLFVEGMAAAYELVRVLRAAGKEPTRAVVLAAVRKLNDASNPFLLPGVVVRTTATDRFPIEQAQLRRFTQGRWQSFGGLWRHRGG